MSEGSLTDSQRDSILDAIQSMGGTIVNIKRYPPGSSIIKMALEKGLISFDSIFSEIELFTVSENERQLLFNEEVLADKIQKRAYVSKFVQSIAERNIKSLTFKRGLDEEELTNFVDILGESPENLKKLGNLDDLLISKNVQHITVDEKVFVALTKGQAVADANDLQRLVQAPDGSIDTEDFREGVFIQYLFSKLPDAAINISDEKLNELKQQIDYDKITNAKEIDINRIAPILAASLDRWSQDVAVMEQELPQQPTVPRQPSKSDDLAGSISPELMQTLSDATGPTTPSEALETSRDERVKKLVDTFEGISRSIFSFKQPQIRAKLLNNFLQIITNFKAHTVVQVLSTKFMDDLEDKVDLKGQILNVLSTKKKSMVIDMFIHRYHRIIEGLNPADFELDYTMVNESQQVLTRLLKEAQDQNTPELLEKAKRAVNLARTIHKEATDQEKLVILKARRFMTKEPSFFLNEKIQSHLADLIIRLLDINRPDVARKIIDKIFANLDNEDAAVRLKITGAVVQVSQGLLDVNNTSIHNNLYNHTLKAFRQEKDPKVFAAFLATMISDLGRLIESGNLQLVIYVLKSVNSLKQTEPDETKKYFLAMCESKITEHQGLFDYLVEEFASDDEKQADMAYKILSTMDADTVAPVMLNILEKSEDRKVRKRALSALTHYPGPLADLIRGRLKEPDLPWYFIRNLINLAGDINSSAAIPQIANHLTHENAQVSKASLAMMLKIGGKQVCQLLGESLPKLDHANQRLVFTFLGNNKSDAGLDFMLSLLNPVLMEKDESLTSDLVVAMGKIGDPKAIPAIKMLIRPNRLSRWFGPKISDRMTMSILQAFGDIGDPSVKEIVDKYIRSGNPEIAKIAQLAARMLEK